MLGAAATVLALAGPSAALANHVTPGASSATCDKLTVQFDAFGNANKPITYSVKVDGAVVKTGSFTFPGSSGRLTLPLHLSAGSHVVRFEGTWPGKTARDTGVFEATVAHCPGPPPPPLPPPPPPPPIPPVVAEVPAAEPPAEVAPSQASAPVPAVAVKGADAASSPAQLSVRRACVARRLTATVSGERLRTVMYWVDGRRLRTITVRAEQKRVSASLTVGRSVVDVRVRVTFRDATPARTLRLTRAGCAPAAVRPRFTG